MDFMWRVLVEDPLQVIGTVGETRLVVCGFGVEVRATAHEGCAVDGAQGGQVEEDDLSKEAARFATEWFVVEVFPESRGGTDDDEDRGVG